MIKTSNLRRKAKIIINGKLRITTSGRSDLRHKEISRSAGSGKTTFIRMLAGLEKPDSGEIKNLRKIFCKGNICVANSLNLDLIKGEIFTILGTRGSGKTTFIRMLAGLEKPDIVTGKQIGRAHV